MAGSIGADDSTFSQVQGSGAGTLKNLHLYNFRGFDDHQMPFRKRTIIVGANNTGKSTSVEALRLVSLVTNRFRNLSYNHPPGALGLPVRQWVVSPSLESISVNFDNVCHLLGDPPSVITATFTEGQVVEVYLVKGERLYATVRDPSGVVVRSKAQAAEVNLPTIHVLSQVAPLLRGEKILTEPYVLANISTELSPLHFRNQLRLMPKEFVEFKKLAGQTWPGLTVRDISSPSGKLGDPLGLFLADGQFVAEAAWMGHGLQMWLQAMWFVARTPSNSIVVLDEPDVYLHPDLQRRLTRLVSSRYDQVIVATHSTEIMSEVEPTEILAIDKNLNQSKFVADQPGAQRIIDQIGSAHNISLARLAADGRFLIVEGDDLDILARLHSVLFPSAETPLRAIPYMALGGWGGWDLAVGSKLTLQNYVGKAVAFYCVLDRDYHTPAQLAKRREQAQSRGIRLHIWSRKELENYLLIPSVISRTIAQRCPAGHVAPSAAVVKAQMGQVAQSLKNDVLDGLGNEFLADNRKGAFSAAMMGANGDIRESWRTVEGRLSRVSGKKVLSEISSWAQAKYGVSFGTMALAREVRANELPAEMIEVLKAIESSEAFTPLRAH